MNAQHIAFIDGSAGGGCHGVPGGWAVLLDGELSCGWFPATTSNTMEIYPALEALQLSPSYTDILIVTDSKLVIGWLSRGWRCKEKHIKDVIEAFNIVKDTKQIKVTFQHASTYMRDASPTTVHKAAYLQMIYARDVHPSRQ
jgi:ribonuclease HI